MLIEKIAYNPAFMTSEAYRHPERFRTRMEPSSTRLTIKSVDAAYCKTNTSGVGTPYSLRIDNGSISFQLILPRYNKVELKVTTPTRNTSEFSLVINGKTFAADQRMYSHRESPLTISNPYDISQVVQPGANIIKLDKCREMSLVEFSASIEEVELTAYQNGGIDVDDIESTQSIQNMAHDVPLIEGKKTAARVYVTVPRTISAGKLTGEIKLTKGDETYYAYSHGSLDVTNANQSNLLQKRKDLNNSLNFILPDDACSGEGEITLNRLYIDTADASYTVDIGENKTRRVTFEKAPPLRLRVIGVRHRDHEDPDCMMQPRQIDYDLIKSWLQRAFPVPFVEFSWIPTDAPQGFTPPFIRQENKIRAQVAAIRNLDMAFSKIDKRTHYYGLVMYHRRNVGMDCCATWMQGRAGIPNLTDPTQVGAGPTGSPRDKGDEYAQNDPDASFGDWYTAHELGHTLGRKHVLTHEREDNEDTQYPYEGGKIGDEAHSYMGFDVGDEALSLELKALPYEEYYDVMSWALPEWLSDYTYKAILNRLREEDKLGYDGNGPVSAEECAVIFEECDVSYKREKLINVIVQQAKITYVNPLKCGFLPTSPPTGTGARLKVHYESIDIASAPDPEDTWVERRGMINAFIKVKISKDWKISKIEYLEEEDDDEFPYIVHENAASIGRVTVPKDATDGVKTITWNSTGGDPVFNVQVYRKSTGEYQRNNWETIAVGLREKSFDLDMKIYGRDTEYIRIMATNGIEAIFSDFYYLTYYDDNMMSFSSYSESPY